MTPLDVKHLDSASGAVKQVIFPPVLVRERRYASGIPTPDFPSLFRPPQESYQRLTYTYKTSTLHGAGPSSVQQHTLIADIVFANPHHPRGRVRPFATDCAHEAQVAVCKWNDETVRGEEPGWDGERLHDGMEGRARTPSWHSDPGMPDERTFGSYSP